MCHCCLMYRYLDLRVFSNMSNLIVILVIRHYQNTSFLTLLKISLLQNYSEHTNLFFLFIWHVKCLPLKLIHTQQKVNESINVIKNYNCDHACPVHSLPHLTLNNVVQLLRHWMYFMKYIGSNICPFIKIQISSKLFVSD